MAQSTGQPAPGLQAECLTLNGCETGNAKATKAYGLPAKYVIHAVGPVWRPRHLDGTEEKLLASCYRRSLEVAEGLGIDERCVSGHQHRHLWIPERTRREDRGR